jgi:hypothetical protein
VSEILPTLTELICELEEHRQNGNDAIEYRVDELLAVLRWNNTPEGKAKNRRKKSLEEVTEYIEVLGPEDGKAALLLVFKAARIRRNAELVEAWLASIDENGSER